LLNFNEFVDDEQWQAEAEALFFVPRE